MNWTAGTALNNGKYVLNTPMGKGVFGLTYQATNTESGQTVVVKTLSETLRQHPEFERFKQRFLILAQRLSYCQHPNLVQVLDYFEEAGRPYLVMDYIQGQTLAELIQSGTLPEAKAVDYIRQIGKAVTVLHGAGLLHRDIKPQNIIYHQDTDSVVLCEPGITCDLTPGVMQTHANLLSSGYAPLEQYVAEGKRTRATDIYALAATLYHLLTGELPLPAPVRKALRARKQNYRFFPNQPQLSSSVKQAIWRGMELSPQKRPQTLDSWLLMLPNSENLSSVQPQILEAEQSQSVQTAVQPTLTQSAIPQPALAQFLVVTPQSTNSTRDTVSTQPKTATLRETQRVNPVAANGKRPITHPGRKSTRRASPLQALFMTGTVAASVGLGFGLALRINSPHSPGSSILHTEQSFPARSDWPIQNPGANVSSPTELLSP
ncbi:MAG TPA: serine/threonine-protein kinase [Cyanophyceae cyanobacterium]